MENRGDKMEFKMELNQDERDILEGKQGETRSKTLFALLMRTIITAKKPFN
jgi:predicted aconitase